MTLKRTRVVVLVILLLIITLVGGAILGGRRLRWEPVTFLGGMASTLVRADVSTVQQSDGVRPPNCGSKSRLWRLRKLC